MMLDGNTAVIDNDFTSHLIETHLDDDCLAERLSIIFSELGIYVAMHPLVYEYELLKDAPRITMLFDRSILNKAEFRDIHQDDPVKKAYYSFLVANLYRDLRGEPLPLSETDIFTRWQRRSSLGEVHSVAMCLTCGCRIFLSDDGDSKVLQNLIKEKALGTVSVYNRKELIDVHLEQGQTKLTRKQRQSLAHGL